MIKYAKDYFIIFMNIDETMRFLREKNWKIKGVTYKITLISATDTLKVVNLVPNYY